jgi:hypothetical protein
VEQAPLELELLELELLIPLEVLPVLLELVPVPELVALLELVDALVAPPAPEPPAPEPPAPEPPAPVSPAPELPQPMPRAIIEPPPMTLRTYRRRFIAISRSRRRLSSRDVHEVGAVRK